MVCAVYVSLRVSDCGNITDKCHPGEQLVLDFRTWTELFCHTIDGHDMRMQQHAVTLSQIMSSC